MVNKYGAPYVTISTTGDYIVNSDETKIKNEIALKKTMIVEYKLVEHDYEKVRQLEKEIKELENKLYSLKLKKQRDNIKTDLKSKGLKPITKEDYKKPEDRTAEDVNNNIKRIMAIYAKK